MHIQATKSNAKLIALTAYASSGKDAFADHMVREFGYEKIGFADKLYELALKLNPIIWRLPFPQRLSKIVSRLGWTEAKRIKSIRKYLQWLGSDVCRVVFGDEFWIEQTKPKILNLLQSNKSVIITNCRFENEAQFVEELGGCVVLVTRPGVGPVNDHESDQGEAFKYAIFKVINDGEIEDLKEWAHACQSAIHGTHVSPIANMAPFESAIHRTIAAGVELVLDAAAPASCEAVKWRERHKLELWPTDSDINVFVDGEIAGNIRYMDNIVEIDVKIAR